MADAADVVALLERRGLPQNGGTPRVLSCAYCDGEPLDLAKRVSERVKAYGYFGIARGYTRSERDLSISEIEAWLDEHQACEERAQRSRMRFEVVY